MEDPVVPFDLVRMLLGDAPPLFLAEILVRVLVIYGYTLLLLRWIGGRSIAQLSMVEFLLVIALGSAVGDSVLYPDVPLLHALAVITAVVVIDKLIDLAIRRFRPVKRIVDGSPVAVMQDGCILTQGMLDRKIGTMELMELLRMEGVENLGQVRAAYVEASGGLSVFLREPPCPGLAIVPPLEIEPPAPPEAGEPAGCLNCGKPAGQIGVPCAACGETRQARLSLAPAA
ncbi:DUF421 domain-containing protein [Paracoccaceae bacterium Fryx2]|nr:DUF421 domain-containing protein [Paracoccaceae bacterium Fryx2]